MAPLDGAVRTFGSLDSEERLPRELVQEAKLWIPRDDPDWRRLASFLWPPALLLTLGVSVAWFHNGLVALAAAVLLFLAFRRFILGRSD